MNAPAFSQGYTMNSTRPLGRGFGPSPASLATPVVFVVDDDSAVRESLELLIRREGWRPETFAWAKEFLAHPRAFVPNCLVLDVSLPESNGLDLQRHLAIERPGMPIISIARLIDVSTTVQAMKAGAVEFFAKPFRDDLLLSAIREALERSAVTLGREAEMRVLQDCYTSLTPRERQVMGLLVSGLLNKQVGGELGISEHTVKVHRGRVMQKMQAYSFAHLVRMAAKLGVALRPERNAPSYTTFG